MCYQCYPCHTVPVPMQTSVSMETLWSDAENTHAFVTSALIYIHCGFNVINCNSGSWVLCIGLNCWRTVDIVKTGICLWPTNCTFSEFQLYETFLFTFWGFLVFAQTHLYIYLIVLIPPSSPSFYKPESLPVCQPTFNMANIPPHKSKQHIWWQPASLIPVCVHHLNDRFNEMTSLILVSESVTTCLLLSAVAKTMTRNACSMHHV